MRLHNVPHVLQAIHVHQDQLLPIGHLVLQINIVFKDLPLELTALPEQTQLA